MQATGERCSDLPAEQRGACRRRQAERLQHRWLQQLAWAPDLTAARQVRLWLGVFPVNWHRLPDPLLLEQQIATIRGHLGGVFAALLTAMVLDPALQPSLNGPANHRASPNENLARELLELFSLGEGHYGEADVREAARALSGYRLEAAPQGGVRRLVLDPRRHDPGTKAILGRSAAFDAATLAAWLAAQPATARHITGRIWRRHVGTPPPPERLETIAAGWRQQELSMPWLMDAVAHAPEAIESRRRAPGGPRPRRLPGEGGRCCAGAGAGRSGGAGTSARAAGDPAARPGDPPQRPRPAGGPGPAPDRQRRLPAGAAARPGRL
jgi:uncharacterized protein (DUF1800 family)